MLKKNMYLVFVFSCVLLTFCKKKEIKHENLEGISPALESCKKFYNTQMVQELKDKVLLGDTLSFKELESIYWDSGHSKEFLYFAQIMAENHDYGRAYYSVYQIIKPDSVNSTNIRINKLAIYYLIKANEKGYEYAKYSLQETFNELSTIPTSSDYWKKIDK